MKKCVDCGKKGIFLKLSYSGRCSSCEEKFQEYQRKIAIENSKRIQAENEARERAKKAEEEAKKMEEERIRKLKEYINYPFASRLSDGWYLVYSYSKIPVSVDKTAFYHGNVKFIPKNDSVDILLDENIVGTVEKTGISKMIIDFLNRDEKVLGKFDSESTVYIAFYKQILKQVEGCENIICKLTNTSKKDEDTDTRRYENLEYMEENDLVKIEYNDDTEKYLLRDDSGNEIGELSKSDSKKVMRKEDDGFEPIGFITEQDYNENDIPTAKVKVFFK